MTTAAVSHAGPDLFKPLVGLAQSVRLGRFGHTPFHHPLTISRLATSARLLTKRPCSRRFAHTHRPLRSKYSTRTWVARRLMNANRCPDAGRDRACLRQRPPALSAKGGSWLWTPTRRGRRQPRFCRFAHAVEGDYARRPPSTLEIPAFPCPTPCCCTRCRLYRLGRARDTTPLRNRLRSCCASHVGDS